MALQSDVELGDVRDAVRTGTAGRGPCSAEAERADGGPAAAVAYDDADEAGAVADAGDRMPLHEGHGGACDVLAADERQAAFDE